MAGGKLPKEACFEDSIYKVMESCWAQDKRPKLETIESKLQDAQQKIRKTGNGCCHRPLYGTETNFIRCPD